MSGWLMGGMWLVWIGVILLIGAGAVFLARSTESRRGDGARRILKERYARGEISKQQYDQMLADISR